MPTPPDIRGLPALTLWPEWAHAVAWLGKPWENRNWAGPDRLIGRRFAIHAGKHIGGRPGRPAMKEGMEALEMTAFGVDLNGFDVDDRAWPADPVMVGRKPARLRPVLTSCIVAAAVLGEPVLNAGQEPPPWCNPDARWWWPLLDVRPLLVPAYCRGGQGFWRVPDPVARLVVEDPGVGDAR